jgi:hypothetical protein
LYVFRYWFPPIPTWKTSFFLVNIPIGMSYSVGNSHQLMLACHITDLIWHDLYVTPPLFWHSNFNDCFCSFEGTFMFFWSVLLRWCRLDLLFAAPASCWCFLSSHKSQIIS